MICAGLAATLREIGNWLVGINRQRIMERSRALAGLAILALAVAGCSASPTVGDDTGSSLSAAPGSRDQAASVTSVPASVPIPTGADLPAGADEVILVRVAAFPEGPVLEADRTDDDAAQVFELLPDELPVPLDQPADCTMGSVTTLELRDGGRVDYGPCRWPDTIDALRGALVQGTSTTSTPADTTDDSPFFGRVVSHELLDGYQGVRVEGEFEWSVGPMILTFADGQSVLVGADTRINTPCIDLPVENTVTDRPCFLVGTGDASGWVTHLRVLSYEILHEGDNAPSLFTNTSGAIAISDESRIHLEDDGTILYADLSRLDVACRGVTELSLVPEADVAGITFVLDPLTGQVIWITCSVFFD